MAGLIYGITTYNQRVIRTYGLNVDMSNAFDAMAASVGKTTEELTEAEKVQAAMNAVLQEGTRITGAYAAAMEEPGKRWRSLPRYVNEIKVALGEAFLPVVGAAADGLTGVAKATLANAEAFTALLRPVGDAAASVITVVTALAELGVESAGAAGQMVLVNDQIAAMGRHTHDTSGDILGLRRSWNALLEVGEIQQGIAAKMQKTADVAAYLSRTVPGTFDQMQRAADGYAAAIEKANRIQWVDPLGAQDLRNRAMQGYNKIVWETAQANGITAASFGDLLAAERAAAAVAVDSEAVRARQWATNQQIAASARAAVPSLLAQAQATTALAYAEARRANQGPAGQWRKGAMSDFAALQDQGGGGGGGDTGKQIAERRAQWERDRVTDARRAALEIRYWEQDQQEWIADNAGTLTAELQAEFAARTAAARAEADQIKETDAGLAQELLSAEADYQQEKASIASDESLSDEERAAKMAVLERENAERVERAKETAALEAQIREEQRQREIQQMREAGAAGGQAFAAEIEAAFGKMQRAEQDRQKRMMKAKEEAKAGYGEIFDDAIADAKELLGLTGQIIPAAGGGSAPPRGGAYSHLPGAGYAQGGVVPGPVGQPQLATVHGGEKIIPPDRVEHGGGGITVLITGPIYATSPQQATRAGEDLGRGLRMAAKAGGITL